MRSHAKAATAGSTQRQAKGLGSIFRGAVAGRGASPRFQGSGAPKSRRLALSLALVVALLSLALGVGSAVAAVPTISSTSVSAVTSTTAVLEAKVNPGGEATTYHFEYGTADCSSNPCTSSPAPNGNVGSGSSAVEVAKEIAGLSPGTTYHFRVVAVNGSGTAEGPDATFATHATPVPDTGCPNQAFRIGTAALLPDCRAYEMVSPIAKGGIGIEARGGALRGGSSFVRAQYLQSSLDGEKFTYTTLGVFGDQPSGRVANQYIAGRGAGGWSSHGINSPLAQRLPGPASVGDLHNQYQLFTSDLSSGWLIDNNLIPLNPDASTNWLNLYRRDNPTGTYETVTEHKPEDFGPMPISTRGFYTFQGHSSDFGQVVFSTLGAYTPDAPVNGESHTYYFSNGKLHLVGVLPDGTATTAATTAGADFGNATIESGASLDNPVSEDGSRVFWSARQGFAGRIYVRVNPDQEQSAIAGGECTEPAKACTLPVSETVTPEAARFWGINRDGSKALFDIASGSLGGNLYELDVDSGTPTLIAGETLGVTGVSESLSHVYFVSKEDLDAGATAGQPNLYLSHQGTKTFIATLSALDVTKSPGVGEIATTVVTPVARYHPTRTTPDGSHHAFISDRSLTGYDNTDAVSGEADREVFLYDASTDELTCASCNPSGARPTGQRELEALAANTTNTEPITDRWAAAWLPTQATGVYAPRALSEDGNRLFFNAFDALVPQDTNGAQDVYQWEAQGSGTCEKAAGCISLISTGQSPARSEFVDADPDGGNVFFETESSIDPSDPGLRDIYVARIGGGYPPPVPPIPCEGDACQGVPAVPHDATPASAAFHGAGNPAPRKARRSCRARQRAKGQAKRKQAKRCKRAKRRAGR